MAQMTTKTSELTRCAWVTDDPLYLEYHDTEWGVPVHDDRRLFEFLVLESSQAGLSWLTILKKREAYREAFDLFDAQKVANYGDAKIAELLENKGIVRNRLKIHSTVTNAQHFLKIQEVFGSFDAYLWQFVSAQPLINAWTSLSEVPATTPESDALSKNLKKRGFKFVGSTIMYAYMQAVGMVNDHVTDCFRYEPLRLEMQAGS